MAVSGGPDSVALFSLLHELQHAGGYSVVAIAHFNHRLRGAEADADEAFCRALAEGAGVSFLAEGRDVAAAAQEFRTSIEDAARRLRYEFLERARVQCDADLIAVGHTRDDQAETFLLRVTRGAGARGLAGIRESRGPIVRPLLDVGREDLHSWLRERRIPYRVDATNSDVSIPRNRIRHDVLPVLERLTPGASEAIARAARLAEDDDNFLEARAIEALSQIVLSDEGRDQGRAIRLRAADLLQIHAAVARRVIRLALGKVAPGRFVGVRHIDAVLELTEGRLDLPGALAEMDAAQGVLTLRSARDVEEKRHNPARANVFRYPLSIPGEVRIPESGVSVSAELLPPGAELPVRSRDAVLVAAAAVEGTLAVRSRLAGDRLRPAGLGGSKKLQDYFVDRKVPRNERDKVPLVVDGRDRIVWIVGHTIAEEFSRDFSVTSPEGAVLLLKVRHLGDSV